MVIKKSSAREVERLLADLGQAGPARDAAVARLAVIGDRAVGHVITFLKRTPSADTIVAALRVLEAVGNGRSLDVAIELLDNPNERVALAATAVVGSQARATSLSSAARAIDALVQTARSDLRPPTVRRAAVEAVKEAAADLAGDLRTAPASDLTAPSAGSAQGETSLGRTSAIAAKDADPDLLRAALADDRTTSIAGLHDAVTAIRAREAAEPDSLNRARWAAARAAAHQALAARGSRVALYDLRETLEEATVPLPVGFVAALREIGDATCLEAIAAALVRIPSDEAWWHDHLTEAFATIVDREGLTRRHAVMKRLAHKHADRLGHLLGPPRGRPPRVSRARS